MDIGGSSTVHPIRVTKPNIFDVDQLNRFDGNDFDRWQDQVKWVLTSVGCFYILNNNLESLPEITPEIDEHQKKAATVTIAKRKNDEVMCRGYILNSFSKMLNNTYRPMKTAREISDALHNKYFNIKKGTDRFIVVNYFDHKFDPNKSVMDESSALDAYIAKLAKLNIVVPDAIQVGAILSKLPLSWNSYRKKILRSNETFTVQELTTNMQIEVENRSREVNLGCEKANYVSVDLLPGLVKNLSTSNGRRKSLKDPLV
ncbi:hypothetical protein LIER_09466 [Lithospermum erythrorhizon]|uniref:Uncharacterized protein n=1 Tax=Lithospermum erythrorhizon TaxID=34254 RepID=A0AAV3PI06_LITER